MPGVTGTTPTNEKRDEHHRRKSEVEVSIKAP
jgi:hypothetical protein